MYKSFQFKSNKQQQEKKKKLELTPLSRDPLENFCIAESGAAEEAKKIQSLALLHPDKEYMFHTLPKNVSSIISNTNKTIENGVQCKQLGVMVTNTVKFHIK